MAKREPSCFPPNHHELVRDWYGRVYAHCRSRLRYASDAEDATQETFLRAIRGWKDLRNTSAIGGWLRRIATNTCVDFLRRKHIDLYENQDIHRVPITDPKSSPDRDASDTELIELIHALPIDLREPVLLHYYEHMTYDEMAQWMGIARSTVNERLSKARHQLRRQLTLQECRDEL